LDHGLQSYIVGGVRKSKSKLANVFNPMNIIEFVSYNSESKLSRIKEANLSVNYISLNFDVVRSSLAMFMIDLARNSIKETESNPVMYNFLRDYLHVLDTKNIELKFLPHYFAIDFAKYLGFEPRDNYDSVCPYFDLREGAFVENETAHNNILNQDLSQKIYHLIGKNTELEIGKQERTVLLDKLLEYYKLHIEGFRELKSLPVLRTLLS